MGRTVIGSIRWATLVQALWCMAHACISRLLCHYLAYLSLLTVQLAAFGPHLCLLSVVWQALLDGLVCQVLCQHKTHCVKLMAGVKVSYMLKWCFFWVTRGGVLANHTGLAQV